MLAALGGGCLVPIGAVTKFGEGRLTIRGVVLSADGRRRVVATHTGPADTPLAVGQELAAMLLAEGADVLIAEFGVRNAE
jgi:hydroxymethylbilane synthase